MFFHTNRKVDSQTRGANKGVCINVNSRSCPAAGVLPVKSNGPQPPWQPAACRSRCQVTVVVFVLNGALFTVLSEKKDLTSTFAHLLHMCVLSHLPTLTFASAHANTHARAHTYKELQRCGCKSRFAFLFFLFFFFHTFLLLIPIHFIPIKGHPSNLKT